MYRLDQWEYDTKKWMERTHRNGHENLAFVQSLGEDLKRIGQRGRIVQLPSGEILDEWQGTFIK